MSCEGEGRIVSAEVPGRKSTDKERGARMRLSSTGGGRTKSSSDNEMDELELERERSAPVLKVSTPRGKRTSKILEVLPSPELRREKALQVELVEV